ncbi:hypothetical protein [Paenibacillus solani]|uniref:hypothetical protein n=1 Tax=Paenibacillus solani TaxID=1705565 RepID=UPI003D29D19F
MIEFISGDENEAKGRVNGKPFYLFVETSDCVNVIGGSFSECETNNVIEAWKRKYVDA